MDSLPIDFFRTLLFTFGACFFAMPISLGLLRMFALYVVVRERQVVVFELLLLLSLSLSPKIGRQPSPDMPSPVHRMISPAISGRRPWPMFLKARFDCMIDLQRFVLIDLFRPGDLRD